MPRSRMPRFLAVGSTLLATFSVLAGCTGAGVPAVSDDEAGDTFSPGSVVGAGDTPGGREGLPQEDPTGLGSTFFSAASIEEFNTLRVPSDGDLWPSCWSNDDSLYAANGDGAGFRGGEDTSIDIAVAKIDGTPESGMRGVNLASRDAVGPIWNRNGRYNRKPSGMVCVGGTLYLAVQDLSLDFDDAPTSTIVKSTDKGRTWTWPSAPMFADGVFSTVFFADHGKDNANAPDGYVYAYGLDNNWRDSFSNRVSDPTELFLARVPSASVQDKGTWEYVAGFNSVDGTPVWSRDLRERQPVLEETSLVYTQTFPTEPRIAQNLTQVSQGSVTYNAPLGRYIYTSWTEYTFEFYEAPQPWGPWKKFLSKDFGIYPWFKDSKHGGYATTIPSKFISADGRTMWVASATFTSGMRDYSFSMRKLTVVPHAENEAPETKGITQLSGPGTGAHLLARALHFGRGHELTDGRTANQTEDSWTGEFKNLDYWGFAFGKTVRLNTLRYTSGAAFPNGGWFDTYRIEVRRNFRWYPVAGVTSSPEYPRSPEAAGNKTFTFRFEATTGDAVRIVGRPGGSGRFTSIAELSAAME